MIAQKHYHDSAVSPVVGVMLMLVVTIIIAAVVSAFAGGLSGSQSKTPQANIVVTGFTVNGPVDGSSTSGQGYPPAFQGPVPDVPTGNPAADIYVTFENTGGDTINLNRVNVVLSSLQKPAEVTTISNALTPIPSNTAIDGYSGIGDKSLINSSSQNWNQYIETPDHGILAHPGDTFVLHADYAGIGTSGSDTTTSTVNWLNANGVYPFWIASGDVLTYQIIDQKSGHTISSGQIDVPEFTTSLVS
jgi:hypothetical protein